MAPTLTISRHGCWSSATSDPRRQSQGDGALALPPLRRDDLCEQGRPPGQRLATLTDARLDHQVELAGLTDGPAQIQREPGDLLDQRRPAGRDVLVGHPATARLPARPGG